MQELPPELLAEIIRRLVQGLKPERIYLFGSRAYGQPDASSDVDLFVIVSSSNLPRHKREVLALRLLFGLACPVDVIVYTRAEADKWRHVRTLLPYRVFNRGKLLYAA
jgi:predicted nucleotidyltransferase